MIFIANEEVVSENSSFNTPGRLGGLVEFFRIMNLNNGRFETEDNILKGMAKITPSTHFENKRDWEPYAKRLDKQLTAFMSEDFTESDMEAVRMME